MLQATIIKSEEYEVHLTAQHFTFTEQMFIKSQFCTSESSLIHEYLTESLNGTRTIRFNFKVPYLNQKLLYLKRGLTPEQRRRLLLHILPLDLCWFGRFVLAFLPREHHSSVNVAAIKVGETYRRRLAEKYLVNGAHLFFFS